MSAGGGGSGGTLAMPYVVEPDEHEGGGAAGSRQPLPLCNLEEPVRGSWDIDQRTFKPTSCRFRRLSVEHAAQCLSKRKLLFLGDSNIRNVGLALASYLVGHEMTNDTARFDRQKPTPFDSQVLSGTGFTDPQHNWTIRVVHRNYHQDWPELAGIIQSEPHDALFIEFGIHATANKWVSLNWMHGSEQLYLHSREGLQPFLDQQCRGARQGWPKSRLPIWMTYNQQCIKKKAPQWRLQGLLVNQLNRVLVRAASKYRFPLLDWTQVFANETDNCAASDDGVHYQQWTERVRASMLVSMLCSDSTQSPPRFRPDAAATTPSPFRADIAHCTACELPRVWSMGGPASGYRNYSIAVGDSNGTALGAPWCTTNGAEDGRAVCINFLPPCNRAHQG